MQGHILVVEDDPITCTLLADILRHAGHSIVTASNGLEAVELLDHTAFDVVLTDIRMPLLDGVQLLERARTHTPAPEVILLTGYGSMETVMAALRAGASNYLLKPCQSDELLSSVEAALHQRALSQARVAALNTIAQSVKQLQRLHAQTQPAPPTEQSQSEGRYLVAGELRIDLYRHTVSFKSQHVHLTPTEYELLQTLAEHPGRVISYSALVQRTHGYAVEEEEAQELLKVHVHRLRRKLSPDLITNVRARGYKLSDAER